MAEFVKGDIVVVPFPFSDLSSSKKRPALVLVSSKGDDLILCQITSRNVRDDIAIIIEQTDIEDGSLNMTSNARPNKLFTADEHIIAYRVGKLNAARMKTVTSVIKVFFIYYLLNIISGELSASQAPMLTTLIITDKHMQRN